LAKFAAIRRPLNKAVIDRISFVNAEGLSSFDVEDSAMMIGK
jgi:hypothetical protein